jgi:hypothetical protein
MQSLKNSLIHKQMMRSLNTIMVPHFHIIRHSQRKRKKEISCKHARIRYIFTQFFNLGLAHLIIKGMEPNYTFSSISWR